MYDVKLDSAIGQKVLRNVYKICKKYMYHIQNSTFEGELSRAQIVKLRYELDEYIRKDKDSIIIFKSRNERWLDKEFWGLEDDKTSNFF